MPRTRRLVSLRQAREPFFVGIDLGGTNTKVGVVDDIGRTLSRVVVPQAPLGRFGFELFGQLVGPLYRTRGDVNIRAPPP